MRYLLDTNICIYIIKKQPVSVIKRLQTLEISDIGLSSITLSELEYGVCKSSKPAQNKLALTEFIAPFEILCYDDKAAQAYGHLRADLEKKRTSIGSLDMLIAAQALALNCVLITNNVKEFKRIQGLEIENWVE